MGIVQGRKNSKQEKKALLKEQGKRISNSVPYQALFSSRPTGGAFQTPIIFCNILASRMGDCDHDHHLMSSRNNFRRHLQGQRTIICYVAVVSIVFIGHPLIKIFFIFSRFGIFAMIRFCEIRFNYMCKIAQSGPERA